MIPEVALRSGGAPPLPVIGFGSAGSYPLDESAELAAILAALELGYRHIDTAAMYGTEPAVGVAVAEAVQRGFVASRSEVFVTSKLWVTHCHPDLVVPAIQETLRNLQMEYLDLYLMHWPLAVKPGPLTFPLKAEDVVPIDLKGVWRAMEECQRLGLTKAIGVSNFTIKILQELLSSAEIAPAVNQVELNVAWRQDKLREFCSEKGIHVMAHSPLGGQRAQKSPLSSEIIKEIADAKGKTAAQVCLRWIYEQGASFVAKSYKKERLKGNLEIFDWELSDEDRLKISRISQHKLCSARGMISNVEALSVDLSEVDCNDDA